jgi:hypothetical protein
MILNHLGNPIKVLTPSTRSLLPGWTLLSAGSTTSIASAKGPLGQIIALPDYLT